MISETDLITINVSVVYMARGRNDFDANSIQYEDRWKGVGPENETFLGP